MTLLLLIGCPDVPILGGTDTDTAGGAEDSVGDSADSEGETADTGGTGCPAVSDTTRTLLVTDIDETLTTDDSEFLTQIADPSHDPEMRPDADTLMQAYAALGYRIMYVTARGEDLSLLDGTSARDATEAWLDVHGFPRFDEDDVYLASGWGAFGSDAAEYKTGVLEELVAEGYTLAYAYGNADTDVEAYIAAGVPGEVDFLVGDLSSTAGDYGVVGITNEDAYTQHYADWMATVPCGG